MPVALGASRKTPEAWYSLNAKNTQQHRCIQNEWGKRGTQSIAEHSVHRAAPSLRGEKWVTFLGRPQYPHLLRSARAPIGLPSFTPRALAAASAASVHTFLNV
jgi:hypothetical protein